MIQPNPLVENLELLARQVVEGFIIGLHKSPFHGFSVEFAEHRLYNQGDPLRHIDWRVYGRTDKLFIKRFEEETNLRCCVVVDTSSSMHFPKEEIQQAAVCLPGSGQPVPVAEAPARRGIAGAFRRADTLYVGLPFGAQPLPPADARIGKDLAVQPAEQKDQCRRCPAPGGGANAQTIACGGVQRYDG